MSLDQILMYVAKIVCQTSLPVLLTWVSLKIFCLEKCQMEFICSAHIAIGNRDNTLVHELWVMAAVELHVYATYYAQYPALKSVYGKDQSVLLCLGSYFPPMSYRTVLSTGSSRDFKTSELNCSYKSMKHYVLHYYHQV